MTLPLILFINLFLNNPTTSCYIVANFILFYQILKRKNYYNFFLIYILISFCPIAAYDICWHIRGCSQGSNSQLLFLLDLPSVCTGPRSILWLGPCKQGLCGGLQHPGQSVSTTRICHEDENFLCLELGHISYH